MEDRHSFLMADVFNCYENEDFPLNIERSGRHPKIEWDNLGWRLGQNTAFPHGLGIVLPTVENRIDGPAG